MNNKEEQKLPSFHVSDDGIARECKARIKCRLGANAPHFDTIEKANAYSQEQQAKVHGILPTQQEVPLSDLDYDEIKLSKLQAQLKEAKPRKDMNELEKKSHTNTLFWEDSTRKGIEEAKGEKPTPEVQLYRDDFDSDKEWSEYYNKVQKDRLNRIDLAAKQNPDGLSPETLMYQDGEGWKRKRYSNAEFKQLSDVEEKERTKNGKMSDKHYRSVRAYNIKHRDDDGNAEFGQLNHGPQGRLTREDMNDMEAGLTRKERMKRLESEMELGERVAHEFKKIRVIDRISEWNKRR